MSNNCSDTEQQFSHRKTNTVNFNNQDLQEFVNISGEIVRNTRDCRSQRNCSKQRSTTTKDTTRGEGLFESISINDDELIKAMAHETAYDTEKYRPDLTRSIENLLKYFDEDIEVKEKTNFFKCSPKSSEGLVATAVASLRSKCDLTPSPLATKTIEIVLSSASIQELRKKYESAMEAETTPSPKLQDSGKSPKLRRKKNQVKQLAFLFNNTTNSVIEDSPLPKHTTELRSRNVGKLASPIFTSTPSKFPICKTKLASPKPSPLFKRKHLTKVCGIKLEADSPGVKNKEPGNTACPMAGSVFSQLSVKDKVLLYNNFIDEMTKQNPKFSNHAGLVESKQMPRGEVVIEKQDSVQHLRASLEAKISSIRALSTTSKSPLDTSHKSKEYANVLQKSRLNDSQNLSPSMCNQSSLEANKHLAQATKRNKKTDVTFSEDITVLQQSQKRSQSMIRSQYSVEPLAPPKKIRHFCQEHLAPEMVFKNPRLEKLFYYWLKNKNGVSFDITAADNKNNGTKNTADEVSPRQTVQSSKSETFRVDNKKNNGIAIIKHTLENENSPDKSVIEIELPLEDQQLEAKSLPPEGSDSGLTSANQTTSEGSQTDLKAHNLASPNAKHLRKKKIRRNFMLDNEISVEQKPKTSSTDSDSDYKTTNIEGQSLSTNCVKNTILNRRQSFTAENLHTDQPGNRNDISRSCPSLLENEFDSNIGYLKDKSISEQITKFVQPKLQDQQNRLMESFTDTGFSIYSTKIDSPVRINIKHKYNTNKSGHTADNFSISYKVNTQQQAFTAQTGLDKCMPISVITSNCNQPKATDVSKAKGVGSPEAKSDRTNTCSSLNETSFYSQASVGNRSNFNLNASQQADTSQFWISSGEFTAAVSIHYHKPERLTLLYNIYAQNSLKAKAVSFGIDDQKFSSDRNDILDEILNKVTQRNGCSQYWFSNDNFVMPFKGPRMSTEKIQKFFNYIREFMKKPETLRFGIDGYDFSNIYEESADPATPTNCSKWTQIISSPLKTSDLDHSDPDPEACEQSPILASTPILQEILWNFAANENKLTVAERVKSLEDQQAQFKVLKETQTNYINSSIARVANESFRHVMQARNNAGRGTPKTTAV